MQEPTRREPIEHLAELYAVVAGLALTSAVGDVLFPVGSDLAFDWLELLVGFGFVATLVPFVHGALVYLHRRHATPPATSRESWLVVWDFFLLFVEAIVLLVAARVVDQPRSLIGVLIVLWAIDIVWIAVGEVLVRSSPGPTRLNWTRTNVGAIGAGGMVWLLASDGTSTTVAFMVTAVAVGRTIFDYWKGAANYFEPRRDPR